MAIARDILSGLFGATAGGLRGYATRQAEERERMQRQQEIEAAREFETGMMQERQAAQRAAARRAALQAKLERQATERYRAAQLQQDADEAKADADEAEAKRLDEQFANITREFGAITRARAQAMQPPLSETEEIDLIRTLAVMSGVKEESVAPMIQRLSATPPEAPEPASEPAPEPTQRLVDVYRAQREPEPAQFTEAELGDELNQLTEAKDYFESERGVKLGPDFRGVASGIGPSIVGGTDQDRSQYRSVLNRIETVNRLLASGQFR